MDGDVPARPQGLRLPPQSSRRLAAGGAGTAGQGSLPAAPSTGVMGSLRGFGFQFGVGVGTSLLGDPLSPEQQQQTFLSRLLLLLGSFVIMCLLIF